MDDGARDVLADAFNTMRGGALRGYDVADRLMHALDEAGYRIVLDEERAFLRSLVPNPVKDIRRLDARGDRIDGYRGEVPAETPPGDQP